MVCAQISILYLIGAARHFPFGYEGQRTPVVSAARCLQPSEDERVSRETSFTSSNPALSNHWE